MHDVPLGNVPHDALVGVHILIVVVGVVVDFSVRRGAHAVDAVEQGGFARAAPADHRHERARFDAESHVRNEGDLPVRVPVLHPLAHVHRVDADSALRRGKEQGVAVEYVRRRGDGQAVVVVQLLPLDLFVVHIGAAHAVRVLNVAVLPVKHDEKVLFGYERVIHADVAPLAAAHRRHRLCGQIEVVFRFFAAELLHRGDAHDVRLLLLPRAADGEYAVELDHRALEAAPVEQHHAPGVFGRHVLRVPYIVFQEQAHLNRLHILRFYDDIRRALGADGQLRALFAVRKAEQVAFLRFQYQVFHGRSPFSPLLYHTPRPAGNRAAVESAFFIASAAEKIARPAEFRQGGQIACAQRYRPRGQVVPAAFSRAAAKGYSDRMRCTPSGQKSPSARTRSPD